MDAPSGSSGAKSAASCRMRATVSMMSASPSLITAKVMAGTPSIRAMTRGSAKPSSMSATSPTRTTGPRNVVRTGTAATASGSGNSARVTSASSLR